jgi:hypothetical protein
MALWWIGNIVFLLVIVPVVVALLHQLLRPALQIRGYAERLAENAPLLAEHMEALGDLERTPRLLDEVAQGLERYRDALEGRR